MGRHKKPVTPPPQTAGLASVPAVPDALRGETARSKWAETAAVLVPAGLLTAADLDALESYCRAWQIVAECDAALEQHGTFFTAQSGYVGQHPAVNQRFKALDGIRRFHKSFGMTPEARNAVTAAAPADASAAEFFG